jgi:predicted RND superfamily exporter protein
MDLTQITQEQRDAIFKEELNKKRIQELKTEGDRKTWKEMAAEQADTFGDDLFEISETLITAKAKTFSFFSDILKLKIELFGGSEQKSHTISGKKYKIQLGRNTIDGHDDTMQSGIEKCEKFLESLIKSEANKEIIIILKGLLKSDRDKKMDSKRILELTKFANELNNPEFLDGVKIIQDAYERSMTSYFVKLESKNEQGAWANIPLSFSSVPFPDGFETDLFKGEE